jgi:menaquinone-dependent protoporphyrinogen oxidase
MATMTVQAKSILVAYTTNSGTTEETARTIADELCKDGTRVDVRRLEEVTSLDAYTAAVIGAPMILGWHRAAANFVKKNEQALSRMPVAYFITAMSLTSPDGKPVPGAPVFVDPGLAKPPKNPGRLGLKERYTAVSNYASQPLNAAPGVKPVSVGIFGGKLEMYRLKPLHMLFVMVILRGPFGSLQNWPAVQEWARQVGAAFASKRAG